MAADATKVVTGQAASDDATYTYDGKDYKVIKEGMASILIPSALKDQKEKGDEVQQVFYNPIQQFNRDLSVLAIRAHGEETVARRMAHPAAQRAKEKKKRQRAEEDDHSDRPNKVQVSESATSGDVTAAAAASAQLLAETAAASAAGAGNAENVDAQAPAPAPAQGGQADDKPSAPKFTILDALSASGLRALRYSHELPFVTSVTANDLTKSAAESIKLNVQHNKLEDKIVISHDDAIAHMYRRIADDLSQRDSRGRPSKRNKYDVVDLDPYGTAAPFLDAAVQAVRNDGGLLCITCTDGGNLAGHAYVERSYNMYGAIPIKGEHSHEVGLRMMLHAISGIAARHGLAIEPVLSLSIDFYFRVFVRVRQNAQAVTFNGSKQMIMYDCSGCGAWETEFMVRTRPHPKKNGKGFFYKHGLPKGPASDQKCRHCGSTMHLAGPLYGGPLHDADFVQRMLDLLANADPQVYGTIPRIEGMLTTALEELLPGPEPREGVDPKDAEYARVDHTPFFVVPSRLAGALNAQSIPEAMFRGAILHLGYQATRSHCKPGSIKTDAPWETIWFIMKEWVRQKFPVKAERVKPGSPAYVILGLGEKEKGKENKEDGSGAAEAATANGKGGETGEPGKEGDVQMGEADAETEETTTTGTEEEELRKTLVFDDALARKGKERGHRKLVRYQVNPQNWGPLSRAKGR